MTRDVFQFLGDIFAERLERATAVAAGITGRQDFF